MESSLLLYEEFLQAIHKSKKCQDQPSLITYLRERNFRFTQLPYLTRYFSNPPDILSKHLPYAFMIRRFKETKNPFNEQYDTNMLFGFKLDGSKNKVLVYIEERYHSRLRLKWPTTNLINYKKIDCMKFPKEMTIEERFKWRQENYKLKRKGSQQGASEFFLLWLPIIEATNIQAKDKSILN